MPDPARESVSATTTTRPGAIELWLVAAVFLSGLVLRAAWPSRLAVEHFDEGVYASNIFFSGEAGDERYPDQHLYAPPLMPVLIEAVMVLLGPSNAAAMAVNVVAGSFTILLIWWVGRQWFGAPAGLAAATLLAFNDVHVFFSRTALTDVLLCFWLIAAVYFFGEAITTGRKFALVAAGVTTGLAWWTKYNGWLPLAIGLAGVVPWSSLARADATIVDKLPRSTAARNARVLAASVGKWAMVAAVAFLVWSPWLWMLQAKGGYAAVAANHRGYLVGLSGWWDSLTRQGARLRELDGCLSLQAPLLAVAACLIYHRVSRGRSTWNVIHENRVVLAALPVVFALSAAASSMLAIGLLGLLATGWILWGRLRGTVCWRGRSTANLGGWLLAAWFVGLLLSTPLYTPYPRLVLPWLMACFLGAGFVVGRATGGGDECATDPVAALAGAADSLRSNPDLHLPPAQKERAAALALIVLCALAALELLTLRRGVPAWESRLGVAEAVPSVVSFVQRAQDAADLGERSDLDSFVIYTCGEPAALFQLRLAGVRWVRAIKDLGLASPNAPRPRLASFVLLGARARHSPGLTGQVVDRQSRLRLIKLLPYRHSLLISLDEPDADASSRDAVLELYMVQ